MSQTVHAAERAAGQVKTMSTYDPDSDQLHEECGIFGVWAPDRDVARLTYFGLRALQRRGHRRESPWVMAARLWFAKTWDCSIACSPTPTCRRSPASWPWATCAMAPPRRAGKPRSRIFPPSTASLSRLLTTALWSTTDELRRQLIELGVPYLSNSDSEVATKLIGCLPAYGPPARGHSQDHGARARRLRHDAHQRAGALRIPRSARHWPANGALVDEGVRPGRCRIH